jgi:hypothetical protein
MERNKLDEYIEHSGASVLLRRKTADGEVAIFAKPSVDESPEAVAAVKRMDAAYAALNARLKLEPVSKALLLAINEVTASVQEAIKIKNAAHRKNVEWMVAMLEELRKVEAQAKGRQRAIKDPVAREKATAKAEAETLWNEWMDKKPKRTWTNEKFALEAMRRWPGKFGSIGVVVGWIPAWKRARKVKGGGNA